MSDSQDVKDAVDQFIGSRALSGENIFNPRVENFVGDLTVTGLFRLVFDFGHGTDIGTGSTILKVPSLASFYNTRWKHSLIYAREARFYATILPALYWIGKCESFSPKVYVVTQRKALVLEDLSLSGFTTVPTLESLDLNHSLLLLQVLARYHVYSYIYFQKLENDSIKQLIGPQESTIRRAIDKEEFDNICIMVKPLLSEKLYKKVLIGENEILSPFPIQNKNGPSGMNVIMHGDLHRNNFLFNYDSYKTLSEVKLINWKTGTVGNPALDLIYFFVHNLHEEFFEANEDSLLGFYIATFNSKLSSLKSDTLYQRFKLNRDMSFFKYYYFRALSDITVHWGASHSSENYDFIAKNIAKWIMYFEKKGFI